MTWQLSLAGLAVGVLVGLAGMGGGSLMTPILIIAFGFDPTIAVGTDIFHGAIFKSVGGLQHHRLGTVSARLSGWMFLGSAPFSLLGVVTATWLKHHYGDTVQSVEGRVLAAALLVGGLGLLAKSLVRFREHPDTPFVMTRRDKLAAMAIGVLGGYVVGLTSVGSGVFFGLTLLVVFPLRSHKVVGTDILHAAGLLWVAGVGHLIAGNVDLRAVGWLLLGSVPGVLAGSRLTVHLPERRLRALIGGLLVASAVKLFEPPHADLLALAVLAALAFAFSGSLWQTRAGRLGSSAGAPPQEPNHEPSPAPPPTV